MDEFTLWTNPSHSRWTPGKVHVVYDKGVGMRTACGQWPSHPRYVAPAPSETFRGKLDKVSCGSCVKAVRR